MATKEAIRLRRQRVLALTLNKVSIDQIAQRLGWDRHTIWNDIVAIRREIHSHPELGNKEFKTASLIEWSLPLESWPRY